MANYMLYVLLWVCVAALTGWVLGFKIALAGQLCTLAALEQTCTAREDERSTADKIRIFLTTAATPWPTSIELSSSVLMKWTKCLCSREPLLIFLHYRRLPSSWLWFLVCFNLLFVGQSAERRFLSGGSQWLLATAREDYSEGWMADASLVWKSWEDTWEKKTEA